MPDVSSTVVDSTESPASFFTDFSARVTTPVDDTDRSLLDDMAACACFSNLYEADLSSLENVKAMMDAVKNIALRVGRFKSPKPCSYSWNNIYFQFNNTLRRYTMIDNYVNIN